MKGNKIVTILCVFASIYICQGQVTKGLAAYYSFNSGNANDESGNNNHGVVNGAVLTKDRFGNDNKAYQLNQGQTIIVPDADTLDGMKTGMTISFWIKVAFVNSSNNILITKFTHCTGVKDDAYMIRVNQNGQLFVQLDDSTAYDAWQITDVSINNNYWHHIAIVWNKPQVMIYIDGFPDVTGNYTVFNSRINNSPEALVFGHAITNNCSETYKYGEVLDDIRIYARALDSLEIDTLVNEVNPILAEVNENGIHNKIITVYPNPSQGILFLSDYADVIVTDIAGKVIFEMKNTEKIDISHQQSGMYFISATDIDSRLVQKFKVIRE